MNVSKFVFLFVIFFSICYFAFVYHQKALLSTRGKWNRLLLLCFFSFGVAWVGASPMVKQTVVDDKEPTVEITEEGSQDVKEKSIAYIKLDVPLINQMEEPQLYNGCEVTSLAMVLNYYGLDVSKEELAEKIPKVPYKNDEGIYGNPNEGFVGDIFGENEGYGVYVEPIIELAEQYLTSSYEIKNLTEKKFDEVLGQLALGTPIWCITTVPMAPTDDMEIWKTEEGEVQISWNIHSVVLTGFDEKQVFVNDPYGEKTAVDLVDFRRAWEQMGSQAMTVQLKES